MQALGLRVEGVGSRVEGEGCRVQSLGCAEVGVQRPRFVGLKGRTRKSWGLSVMRSRDEHCSRPGTDKGPESLP